MFADIHAHILAGLDDGASDSDLALRMLEMACLDGIRHIVATPHFTPSCDHAGAGADIAAKRNDTDTVSKKVTELRELAARKNLDIRIYPGSEVMLHPDVPAVFDSGCICTLNETRYVLVEFPLYDIPEYVDDVLYRLQLKGLIPVLAHPERCSRIIRDPGVLSDFIKRGMLAQVNASSLTGGYGRRIRKTALKLIREGLIQFVASDAHNIDSRKPELGKAADIVVKKFGSDAAEKLFYCNALAVLENRQVAVRQGKVSGKINLFTGVLRAYKRSV